MANGSVINSATRPAIGGSGVTVMKWNSQTGSEIIAFCNGVTVNYPTAIATEVEVQPLDAIRPVEIVTSRAITGGTITMTLTSLYNQQIWDRFSDLAGSRDLADIFQTVKSIYQRNSAAGFTVQRVTYPIIPDHPPYHELFHGCVVTAVADGLNIVNNSMLLDRTMTLHFRTHTKGSGSGWQNVAGSAIKDTINATFGGRA